MRLFSYLLLLFCSLTFNSLKGQDIPKAMSPPRLVNDFARVFTLSDRENLENMLVAYNDSTSTQIYVVTVDDLQGYSVSDYAYRIGQDWGVGQKGKDNGAVILIKPKKGNSRGQVYIAVGYGLEEKLNDARVGRIIDNSMIPYFSRDDYYNGTRAAIEVMINYLSGQFQGDPENDGKLSAFDIITLILLFILFIYISTKSKNNRGNGSNRGGGFFPPMAGGGFGRSSRSSGGFGGGGGGSFGGGGAGRSW